MVVLLLLLPLSLLLLLLRLLLLEDTRLAARTSAAPVSCGELRLFRLLVPLLLLLLLQAVAAETEDVCLFCLWGVAAYPALLLQQRLVRSCLLLLSQ